MKRIIITGSAGYIGKHLYKSLSRENEVVGIDIVKSNTTDEMIDVTNSKQLRDFLEINDCEIIIHTGAIKDLSGCEDNKIRAWETNVASTNTIVQHSSGKKNIKIVYISSDVVFDGAKGDYLTTDLPNPINWYGQTKLQSELLLRQLENYAICRTALVIGDLEGQYITNLKNELDHNVLKNQTLLPHYVFQRLSKGKHVNFPKGIISSPTHVNLIVAGISKIIDLDSRGLFHLTGSEQISRFDFAIKVAAYGKLNKKLIIADESNISSLRPKNIGMDIKETYSRLELNPKDWDVNSSLNQINFNYK